MSPFERVGERAQRGALAVLSVLLVALSIWLALAGRELVTPEAPSGIVSYELAGNAERSAAILGSWPAGTRARAMLVQQVDFLYLLVYPAWFSLVAARLGARLGGRWRPSGSAVSWAVLAAAPLDAVENAALIRQLIHGPSGLDALVAWWCAVPKFALVAAAAVFVVLAGSARLFAGRRASRPADTRGA